MIQYVLSAQPIDQLSFIDLPEKNRDELNRLLRNFFWQGTGDKKKISLLAWDKVCKPKDEGGVGIKDIKIQGKAL